MEPRWLRKRLHALHSKVSIVVTRCCAQSREKLTISATMKMEVRSLESEAP